MLRRSKSRSVIDASSRGRWEASSKVHLFGCHYLRPLGRDARVLSLDEKENTLSVRKGTLVGGKVRDPSKNEQQKDYPLQLIAKWEATAVGGEETGLTVTVMTEEEGGEVDDRKKIVFPSFAERSRFVEVLSRAKQAMDQTAPTRGRRMTAYEMAAAAHASGSSTDGRSGSGTSAAAASVAKEAGGGVVAAAAEAATAAAAATGGGGQAEGKDRGGAGSDGDKQDEEEEDEEEEEKICASASFETSGDAAAPPAAAAPAPAPAADQPQGVSHAAFRERLTRFYLVHNSEKLADIEGLVIKYHDRQEPLFAQMVAKYGPEPSDEDVSRARSRPSLRPPGTSAHAASDRIVSASFEGTYDQATLERRLSTPSESAMTLLQKLSLRLDKLESQTRELDEKLTEETLLTDKEIRGGAIKEVGNLQATICKLEAEKDQVFTGDLTTGKEEAKLLRKAIQKRVDAAMAIVTAMASRVRVATAASKGV